MHQLNLPVQLQQETDFASYVPGPNSETLAAVASWAARSGEAFLYLFGRHGSGKTHLLQAACRRATLDARTAIYLPLADSDLEPSVLENLESCDLVALDDLQAVAGNILWERSLFDLYNRLREAGGRLLASADTPVCELPLKLADLRSRLGWGPGYRLRDFSEEHCEQLLREGARCRGINLGTESVRYILRRCPREPAYLTALLEEIDRESLRSQRRATLPLVRKILQARTQ